MSVEDSKLIGDVQRIANSYISMGMDRTSAMGAVDLWSLVRQAAESNPFDALDEAERLSEEISEHRRAGEAVSVEVASRNKADLNAVERALTYARGIQPRLIELMRESNFDTSKFASYGSSETVSGLIIRSLVMSSLHGRACLLAAEIHALLCLGFTEGAAARARALYETLVLTHVLARDHDATISDRLHAASMAEYERYAKSYMRHADPNEKEATLLSEPLKIGAAVSQAFAADLSKSYEWARPMFPDKSAKSPIHFGDLEDLVGATHLKPRHITLHWAVHVTPYSLVSAGDFSCDNFVDIGPKIDTDETAHLCEITVQWLSDICFHALKNAAWPAERFDDLYLVANLLLLAERYCGPVNPEPSELTT